MFQEGDNKYVKAALAEWNRRQRNKADPFACPTFRLDALEIIEIEQIVDRAKQLRSGERSESQ